MFSSTVDVFNCVDIYIRLKQNTDKVADYFFWYRMLFRQRLTHPCNTIVVYNKHSLNKDNSIYSKPHVAQHREYASIEKSVLINSRWRMFHLRPAE